MNTEATEDRNEATEKNGDDRVAVAGLQDLPVSTEESKDEYAEMKHELMAHDRSSSSQDEISIDDAVDALGCGKFQTRVLIAAGLCFVADSMEVSLLSFLSAVLKSEWNLTPHQTASVTSSVFAGALLGTLILGPMGDRRGRRPIYLLSAVIISLFGFGTALAYSFATLVAMRFMVGFGVGGLIIPFDILAEFLPTKDRGKHLLLIEYFWTLGSLSVPVCAYLSFGTGGSWNLFVTLCAFPCLVGAIVGFFWVPESPRWLVAQGRTAEAMEILKKAAVINGKDPDEIFPSSVVLKEETEEKSNFTDLFKSKWRRLTLLLWGVWFGFGFAYYGTILTVTRVFQTEDISTDGGTPSFNFKSIFISASAEIVGTTLVIMAVDGFGRIRTQVLFYSLGGVCAFIFCLPQLADSVELLTLFAFCARIFEMGATCTSWVTTAEVLETEIRTTGHSAANAVARIGGFISPYLVEGDASLFVVGVVLLTMNIFIAVCASGIPETKGRVMGIFHSALRGEHDYNAATSAPKDSHIQPVV